MKLSVIIVNYKSWNHLERCLNSLVAINKLDFFLEIVVVDNDSASDKRQEFISKFDAVNFVGNSGNNGFANGCNLGARIASGDYYLFLNPDTIVSSETISGMFHTAISNDDYGIVSCVQLDKRGAKEKEIRFFPRLNTLFGLFRSMYRFSIRKKLVELFGSTNKVIFPDWVSGSVVLISKSLFEKVNGWNEDYWMYYEDVDLCKRVTEIGAKVALLRDYSIVHNHGGASRVNMNTSALTRSQVLISKHVYIDKYFSGFSRAVLQTILVFYNFVIKFFGAVLGVLLFFIPKMYLRFFVYKNLVSYYKCCFKYNTWLSKKSMNHVLNKCRVESTSGVIRIGFDAKRVYHNRTGLGNYSRDLVSILSKYYKENKYFLYNPKKKQIDRLNKTSNIVEVLPAAWLWKKYSSLWRQGPVVKQLLKDGVQIFHGLSGEIPRGLEKTKLKSVVTIHDLIFIRYPHLYKYMDRKIHFRKFLYATKTVDVIIAISEQTKRDIVEFLGADPKKIKVIYQGCHRYFKEEFSENFKNAVREKFQLPEKYILNVGTIEERKNLLTAVKAIDNLDVNLVVVGGETSYLNVVKRYIKQEDISDKVIFLTGVDLKELVVLYQMADLFVYPSHFEGFGIPIIEALYSKIPVISSKGGCFAEAGGPNSIYVDPNDAEELKAKIELVLSDANLRDKMITEGFEFVQKFNDKDIATNIMNVYKEYI